MQRSRSFQAPSGYLTFKSDKKYILDNNNCVLEVDILNWFKWFQENPDKKIVAQDCIDGKTIHTAFFGSKNRLFETLIFDEDGEEFYCESAKTWKEALKCHQGAIKWLVLTTEELSHIKSV